MNTRELYNKNVNIMKYFREKNDTQENSMDAVLLAYDYQAGTYTKNYLYGTEKNEYLLNGESVRLYPRDYTRIAAQCIAEELNKLDFKSLMEVGVGEATTICDVMKNLKDGPKEAYGLELSLSRLLWAKKFAQKKQEEINFLLGNMFELPFPNDAIDVVFTYYCIDSHRGKEKQAIEEMLRVCRKYLILIEPSYELGNEQTKKRIDEMCYIKNICMTLDGINNISIVEHRLFNVFTPNNNSAITIIEKQHQATENLNDKYVCPACKSKLVFYKNNYFCNECLSVYPVIDGVPLLLKENRILCSNYTKDIEKEIDFKEET